MQVATLFRESATLLGASMEAGELHGLKMHAFSEGSMKQEPANDDGYETGVDHFEIRGHSQGEQGKMNHANMMDQHMQNASQIQQMHHAHQQQHHHHHHGIALEHRLHVRRQQENHPGQENHRMGSQVGESHLENRLRDAHTPHEVGLNHRQSERDGRMNSLDGRLGGSEDGRVRDCHLVATTEQETCVNGMENAMNDIDGGGRLQNHEGRVGGSNRDGRIRESHMNSVANRLGNRENHMNSIENRMGHESRQMNGNENQVVNHESRVGNGNHEPGIENHVAALESRMSHESHLNNLENRMGPRGNHLTGLETRLGHDSHANGMVDKRVGSRENQSNGLEGRMNDREGRANGLVDGRMMGGHDGHIGGLDGRMLGHESHHPLEGRMPENRDNHMMKGLESRLAGGRESVVGHAGGLLGGIDAREGILNAHVGLHVARAGPHDHLQPHPHVQNLHHPAHHPHAHHMHHPHHGHHGHQHPHSHVKCESLEDPYSFVEDDHGTGLSGPPHVTPQPRPSPVMLQPMPKKRGRKKKIKPEDGLGEAGDLLKKENGLVKPTKERKKHDRFNGMPEEEVVKRTLPDHLTTNLDIVIIGINPGLFAAYKGHHYAGPGNHFWKCLYLSGLTPEPMTADDDYKLLSVGIGFTNMVARATKGSADLTRKEIKEGSQILLEKLQKFKPKIAVFNGKLIYEVFSGNKDFNFGRQPDFVDGTNTYMWVMPSSSARCAQLPRAADKVPFYAALKKFRDYLNGLIAELDENEVVFNDQKLKTFYESDVKIESKDDDQGNYYSFSRLPGNELTDLSNAVVKKEPYDPSRPEKKKRGRPKKIRVEGEETPPKEKTKKEKLAVEGDTPKKKRGRPKKIKTENGMATEQRMAPQNVQGGALNVSEHTSSSNPASTCFSPPIQSPSGFCQAFSPAYPSQAHNPGVPPPYNPRPPSPAYRPSPLPPHYSQSPPPASQSQPFTHSDLSSEISAAISSEHLGSPPPTSPSLGPPDFEPPTSMTDEPAAPMAVKEEPEQECRFSSPAPSESTYGYRGFPEPELEHKAAVAAAAASQFQRRPSPVEFAPKRGSQDVSSKSLSGLESLVDQIPSIAEGGGGNSAGGSSGEGFEPSQQHSGQYEDYLGYPGYGSGTAPSQPATYAHYPSSTNYSAAGYLPPSQTSFSVSSLANSSSHGGHEPQPPVASSFSVSSLASNYPAPAGYSNLMGAPHLVVPQPGLFPAGMNVAANYQYPGQYPSSPASFPYSPHALHVPSPNYPAYGPYGNSSYHPQPYLSNHVLDRIKQERMDIGFGGF